MRWAGFGFSGFGWGLAGFLRREARGTRWDETQGPDAGTERARDTRGYQLTTSQQATKKQANQPANQPKTAVFVLLPSWNVGQCRFRAESNLNMLPSMVRAVAFLRLSSYFLIGLSQQGLKEHLANKVDCTKV